MSGPALGTSRDPIPVSILTGFLGSGKTTLLNHLLASPGMSRTAVLINEFGEVGIDQLIVREIDPAAVLLKSGCICCTVQGELVDGLKELFLKKLAGTLPPFERVAIETTGLADPLPIITCLMRDPLFKHAYRLEGLLTTVDAVHGEAQLDRHVEAVRQAAVADRIVLTKTDLADAGTTARLRARLERLNPRARVLTAVNGAADPAQLFDGALFDPRAQQPEVRRMLQAEAAPRQGHDHDHAHGHHDHGQERPNLNRHDEHIVSHVVTLDEPVSIEAFRRWYDDFAERRADHLLRVKGILNVRGEPRPYVVHCVQATQHPAQPLASWPDADRRSRIVFITSDLPGREIEASLRGYLAQWKDEERAAPGADGGVWLNEAELTRIFSALARQDDWVTGNALRLMLLTGASAEDARTAKWEEFDLPRKVWRKHAGGKSRPRAIPLAEAALLLLAEMRGETDARAGPLFAASGPELPRRRLERVWKGAAASAGVSVSLEALRPITAANLFRGLPEPLARRLLGLALPAAPRR